jgi:signal transduction histidine kinase
LRMNDLELWPSAGEIPSGEMLPAAEVHQRLAAWNAEAWALSDTDAQAAAQLADRAYALAAGLPAADLAGQVGIALSLRTLGYLNMRFGKHPLALTQLTGALDIVDALGRGSTAVPDAQVQGSTLPADLQEGLPDIYDGLAGVYAQTGLYAEALDLIHKQLAAAEHNGDKQRVANAYNNQAYVQLAMEQNERAIVTFHQARTLAVACGDARIECIAHLNLAEMYLITGDYAAAQSHCSEGLEVSRRAGFALFEIFGHRTLGKVHRALGQLDLSYAALNQALAASAQLNSPVSDVAILLELGRTARAAGHVAGALDYLQVAAAQAAAIDGRSELAEVHLLLAEIYEQNGEPAPALAHYKQGQQIQNQITGEKANQHLRVLQVAHDTEVARKEAAQLRDRNDLLEQQVAARTAELTSTVTLLQQEIVQRERAEAEIKAAVASLEQRVAARTDELAAFFDLIPLAGQDGDMNSVFRQILLRITEITRSRALCLHLFDADRTVLHLAGHSNFGPAAADARQIALAPDEFGLWLQQPHAPVLATDPHALGKLPQALAPAGFRTYLGAQIKIAGRTEGLLSCYRATDRGYGIDEIALVTALAEQIGTLLETRRLRRQAEEMAVVAERQRLARDLHDSVTQSLYSLTLFSRAGREAAADGDTTRLHESLTALEHNTLHALREMRLLLYELRPADLAEEGLRRALELRLNTVERRAGLRLDAAIAELPPLPPAAELDLYHIIVEALNNVVKHAAATQVTLHLAQAGHSLRLLIADDGEGIDPRRTGGLGLRNIRERVARLHGELQITSAPHRGTAITVTVPYPPENT